MQESIKQIDYQTIIGRTFTDYQSVVAAQSILNAAINSGDTVVDAQMPTTLFGCALDWSAGSANDLVVKLTKNDHDVTQDLASADAFVPYFQILTMNGGSILGAASTYMQNRCCIVYGDYVVFSESSIGLFGSYNYVTDTWHQPREFSGLTIANSIGYTGYGINNMCIYDGNLVMTTIAGKVFSFDGTNWKKYDGTGSGTGPYNNGTALNTTSAPTMSCSYGSNLVIGSGGLSQSGRIASFDGTNWKNYDGTGTGTGPYDNQTVIGTEGVAALIEYSGNLVVIGQYGRVASFDGTNWKNYDGTGTGTGPYNNGAHNGNQTAYDVVEYGGDLVIVSGLGRVSSFDGTNWKNYDGTGTGTGPYNNATAIGAYSVCKIIVFDSKLVIAGAVGRVASWNGTSWTNYNASSGLRNNATALDSDSIITAMAVYGNHLIIASGSTTSGSPYHYKIASCDSSTYAWHNADGTGSGTGLYSPTGLVQNEQYMNTAIIYDNHLVIPGGEGSIASYNFVTAEWNAYNKAGTGLWNNGTAMGSTGNDNASVIVEYNGSLVFCGNVGRVASWDGTNWKNYDGTGTGTGPYNDGTAMGNLDIYAAVVLNGNLIVIGENCQIASFDGTNWKNYDGTGSGTGPYNDGEILNYYYAYAACVYGGNLVVSGDMSRVASWDGSNWKWWNGTGTGTGPYNEGTLLNVDISEEVDWNSVYAITVYDGKLVFAGDYGRVGSWDGSAWVEYDGDGGGSGPYRGDEGTWVASMAAYHDYLLVGAGSGQISSFDGTNWKNYDGSGSGTGPYNNATAVGSLSVAALVKYTDGVYVVSAYETISSWDGTNWHNYNS